jgi:hypothetical protein
MRPALALILAATGVIACGCGYTDENRRAAAIVAQSYLNALAADRPHAVCRVLAPEIQVGVGRGGTCEQGIIPTLRRRQPHLTVGSVQEIPGPSGNPRLEVAVPGQPGREIILGRYGSIWRVIYGGQPL